MIRTGLSRARRTLTAALLCCAIPALAQTYPTQPVRLVVPYPAGGSTDAIARLYAEGMATELGQPVVVDNRPGAATNIGSETVARATPDGYTVLFGAGGPTLNQVFGPKPSFDPATALQPVSLIARVPFMLAANPKAPFSTVAQFVAAAKAKPGKFSVSSAQLNVYVELMKAQANVDVLHVPYKGGAQAATDAIAGQVDMVYALVPVLLPHVQAGKLKAIGVTSVARQRKVLPNTPSFTEAHVGYSIDTAYNLSAPAGTPAPVVDRLTRATKKVVGDPAFVEKLASMGAQAASSDPESLRRENAANLRTWTELAAKVPSLIQSE
ncbi:MAG: hypothetical protein JSS14_15940 [Proteobacteria bacterium]|nr:hypothetical protein [Pseudomonadota bacterium]